MIELHRIHRVYLINTFHSIFFFRRLWQGDGRGGLAFIVKLMTTRFKPISVHICFLYFTEFEDVYSKREVEKIH